MRTATKLNRNETVPTNAKQWELADLSRVRALPDIASSSSKDKWSLYSRTLFWRPAEWKVECGAKLRQGFVGKQDSWKEGKNERRKERKKALCKNV